MTAESNTDKPKKVISGKSLQPAWQRIILLIVIGYEAAGCLLGGLLLIAAPDGSYMDMPVEMMHGTFSDFLIPGIILFGLGILNTLAFIAVIRQVPSDWFMAGLAMGGLYIWFVVEIIIIRELHWLHAMWGIPVLLGWVLIIPLIYARHTPWKMQKALLACGIISSLWYLAVNIFVPTQDTSYSPVTQTVSELSAIDAPTRILWVLLCSLYPLLYAAFGYGVIASAAGKRSLYAVGSLVIAYSLLNFYWPPMHLREVIAAGQETLSDTLHLTWAKMTLTFNILLMAFGAAASGRGFRIFTFVIFLIFMIFGALIFKESPGIVSGQPTPWIGIWERVNIGAFMFWIAILSLDLMRKITPQRISFG